MKINLSKKNIFEIVVAAVLGLTHIMVIVAVIMSYKYYGIYPSLFGSIVAIVVCLLIILDIVFFVGFNHKDLGLKIVTCILSVLILLGGTVGTYAIAKVNGIVGGILDDGTAGNYEYFSGAFVALKSRKFDSLEKLKNKKVGMLNESTPGLAYIGKSILDEKGFDYATVDTYTNNTELLQALLNGNIDAIVVTSAYKDIYKNDENSTITEHLDELTEIYTFEQSLKVDNNKKKKNLMKEPFNVLLIGWSRTDIGSTVGLADSIIVATINPQTYTVSMMSIARDSFVPISCYGGAYDKINSGRSTSRQCFIETVENFIGMDIDYYMEADYGAIVRIVNVVGGVEIDNPVDFELDGVFVPAGKYVAEGWQALEFCRERHHMPNGDFDRQKHQKEVIMEIARKFIESGDITLPLSAMEQSKEFLDTDFTLQELSTVFNLLLNTKNYTSLDTFDLVDFQNLRITGNGGLLYYSYSMHLPLWVYLIYQGSYDESISHIYDVMGKYDAYDQIYSFEFSGQNPYVRAPFYSLDYENKYVYTPDPMPAYWPTLTGMTIEEAYAWAAANNVDLSISEHIMPGDPRYNAESDGLIYSQNVAYGSLVSEHKSGSVVIMGTGQFDVSKFVPNFIGKNYNDFIDWADSYFGSNYEIKFDTSASGKPGEVVEQSIKVGTSIDIAREEGIKITVKAGTCKITFNKNNTNISQEVVPNELTVTTGDDIIYFTSREYVLADITPEGGDKYIFTGWYLEPECTTQVTSTLSINSDVTLYAGWDKECVHEWNDWEETKAATCSEEGSKKRTCSKCLQEEIETISKLEHTWVDDPNNPDVGATTEADGIDYSICSICGETKSTVIPKLAPEPPAEP